MKSKYINRMVLNSDVYTLFTPLNNFNLGITVVTRKAKRQTEFSEVEITIDDSCIGKRISTSDYMPIEKKVIDIILNYYRPFEKVRI